MTRMDVDGRRRKGRPKRRWMDSVNVDLREKGLSGEETHNKAMWRQLVRYIEVEKDLVEEEVGGEGWIPFAIRYFLGFFCNVRTKI